jgi:uncharacterized protein (TIGR00295 family)
MNTYPDEQSCLRLLKHTGCCPEIVKHCQAVCKLSLQIAKKTNADVDLVRTGALLHDIGRSQTHGIDHGVKGARLAKTIGLSEPVIKIIERHIGAGLTAEEAARLHLPKKDYLPETLEEKIVCHADNLIDDVTRQPIEIEIEKALRDGKKKYAMRLVLLHKELSDLCGIDLNNI